MALRVVLADGRLAGLDVDDHEAARPVAFEPVEPAAHPHRGLTVLGFQHTVDVDLGAHLGELLTGLLPPLREGGQHRAVPCQLVVRIPRRLEWQFLPEPFELGGHLALGPALVGDEGVHQRTDRRPHIAPVAAAVPLQQPAQRAVGQRLQRRRRQPHHVVVTRPQRFVGARRGHAVPLLGVGAGNPCRGQPRQLCCGTCPYRVVDGVLGRADHRAQPADQRRGSQHPRGEHRLGGMGFGVGRELRRVRRETARAASSRRRFRCRPRSPAVGCGRGPWRRSAACAPRPAAVPGWTPRGRSIGDPVEDVDELLGAEHAAAWSRVGPQPFL